MNIQDTLISKVIQKSQFNLLFLLKTDRQKWIYDNAAIYRQKWTCALKHKTNKELNIIYRRLISSRKALENIRT